MSDEKCCPMKILLDKLINSVSITASNGNYSQSGLLTDE